jgi:hypothetical protein
MIHAGSGKKQTAVPLFKGKGIRDNPLFVTRDREPENYRVRDPWSPRLDNCHPFLKDKGKMIKDKTITCP